MLRTKLARMFGIGPANRIGGDQKSRSRRLEAQVEGLESRNLMAAGSVIQSGGLVNITPATTGPNTAIVSYQSVNGNTMLDVNLNGADKYFSLAQVGFVYYLGSGLSGAQTFQNTTSLHTVAWGGSGTNVFVSTSGPDQFFGGSGSNTFYAGSGYDIFIGGTGTNVFNESSTGSGVILRVGANNTINAIPGSLGSYQTF